MRSPRFTISTQRGLSRLVGHVVCGCAHPSLFTVRDRSTVGFDVENHPAWRCVQDGRPVGPSGCPPHLRRPGRACVQNHAQSDWVEAHVSARFRVSETGDAGHPSAEGRLDLRARALAQGPRSPQSLRPRGAVRQRPQRGHRRARRPGLGRGRWRGAALPPTRRHQRQSCAGSRRRRRRSRLRRGRARLELCAHCPLQGDRQVGSVGEADGQRCGSEGRGCLSRERPCSLEDHVWATAGDRPPAGGLAAGVNAGYSRPKSARVCSTTRVPTSWPTWRPPKSSASMWMPPHKRDWPAWSAASK